MMWRQIPDRVRYMIIGALLGAIVTVLALGRYSVSTSERGVAYKVDRLTGRTWWLYGATETLVTTGRP